MTLQKTNAGPSIVAPVVKTTAVPPADLLMTVRALVGKDEELRGLFVQFRQESRSVEWLRDMVAAPISPLIPDQFSFEQVKDACLYLADEYNQLPEGYFIVSTETGKVEAVLTEDDLVDPGLLPRESGEMAQALKRIAPQKEVALVTYNHRRGHDERVLKILAERNHQTQLLKEEGDNRFRMATRAGRTSIAKDLSEDDPRELLRRSGGTSGAFLRHFQLKDQDPHGDNVVVEGGASYRSKIGVQDALSINTSYNRLGNLRGAAAQGWVRNICIELGKKANAVFNQALPVDIDDLTPEMFDSSDLWIARPEVLAEIKAVAPNAIVLPVEGLDTTLGLKGDVGTLVVDSEFEVGTHEQFGRWEVTATVGYRLFVNPTWEGVEVFPIVGAALQAEVV